MALAEDELDQAEPAPARRRRLSMWRWRIALGLMVLVLAALTIAWLSRERIAGTFIAGQLERYDIPATYEIERISPETEILRNIVVGDPAAPDLTIERAIVRLRYRFGTPTIGRITLVRPRLYGTYRDGRLSFGTLDKAIFRDTGEPAKLPDLDLRLVDGRGLLETDYGPVGFKADGEGELDDSFSGVVAVAAPQLDGGGCAARGASLYGRLTTSSGKPRIRGPLRLGRLDCRTAGIALRDAAVELDATGDADLAGVDAKGKLASGTAAYGATGAHGVNGSFRASWRKQSVNANYTLAARGVATPQAQAALVTAEGSVRTTGGFAQAELQAAVEANGVRMGSGLDASLRELGRGTEGTLLAPLVGQVRTALAREGRASRLTANVTVRKTGDVMTLVMPQANLRGGSGDTLLALSAVTLTTAGEGAPRFSGNLATGGRGLPRIAGRMERAANGNAVLRLRMAEYRAGGSSLAIPELVLAQSGRGTIGFAGRAEASGPLPGGSTRGLLLPVSGQWRDGALSLWRKCTDIRFERLAIASLTLERRGLKLCPPAGKAILEQDARGLRIAAGAPSLDVAGRLADTPIRLRSGPIGFAYPGALSARQVDISLGPAATASTFRISNLDATFGKDIAGGFDGADIRLYAVPLNLMEATGRWRYAGGKLTVGDGVFRLVDRGEPARFNPLVARDGTLALADNVITANATLREPDTDRAVTDIAIVHNLASGRGHADLAVAGLTFDEALQPEDLSILALGVIANTRGTITGTGRIDWTEAGVTSSGRFSSDNLDFAAAFGPVKGASGTVEFTDLINLTTAPNQRLKVASVNPGIEVTGGEVIFSLNGGKLLGVQGATWPFMGGTLTLRPVNLNLGVSEARSYVFEIRGLDAALFVERLELNNISASGIFDGEVPIVFDAAGNGSIEGGELASRPPGGNIAYIGELTYEDMGAIANFAFSALRSLDYQRMTVNLNGNLAGEIITELRFEGVAQGEGTKQNFITRQIAGLPIEFHINIRAAFAQLLTSLRSLYDPAFVRDPRELGLLSDDGTRLRREVQPGPEAIKPEDIIPDEPPVQTQESETQP
jgi:hypothetical protein